MIYFYACVLFLLLIVYCIHLYSFCALVSIELEIFCFTQYVDIIALLAL